MAMKRWAGVVLAVFLLAQLSASENTGANKVGVIKSELFFGGFNSTRPGPSSPQPLSAPSSSSTSQPFFGSPNCTRPAAPATSSRIIVGGSVRWRFGYNYTDWASRTGPFYKNDTLVFMYDPPSNGTFPHNVYLLKDYRSFLTCDLRNAKLVGGVAQGGGAGYAFVLRRSRPHYFACGVGDGFHCRVGMMKFPVFPFPFKRWH